MYSTHITYKEIKKRVDKTFLIIYEITQLKTKSRNEFLEGKNTSEKDRKRYNSLLLLYKNETRTINELYKKIGVHYG